jgi:very-short-patch-repair endonuclease
MKIYEYIKNPKICKNCGEPLPYNKRKNIFCDSSCAGKYNNKYRDTSYITEEFKQKARDKTIEKNKEKFGENYQFDYSRYDFDINCYVCNKSLTQKQIRRKNSRKKFIKKSYCSNRCRSLDASEETNEKIRQTKLESVKNGTHKGWTSRYITSYPEKFFIEVLKNNRLEYKHNFIISKRDLGLNDISNYFLDFYFEDKKIDLEIDGKQHSYEDRKEKDIARDKLLDNVGIKVYRIKWKNPINEANKEYLNKEIQKFLEFYETYKLIPGNKGSNAF